MSDSMSSVNYLLEMAIVVGSAIVLNRDVCIIEQLLHVNRM